MNSFFGWENVELVLLVEAMVIYRWQPAIISSYERFSRQLQGFHRCVTWNCAMLNKHAFSLFAYQ